LKVQIADVSQRRWPWLGVPVHPQLELLDTDLRFRVWERSCFHGMVEFGFHTLKLSPVATPFSTHAFFGSLGSINIVRRKDHLMSAKRKLKDALSAIDDAMRALKRARDNAPEDENVRRAIRELDDADSYIRRAVREVED
jgi:hypothetical protein